MTDRPATPPQLLCIPEIRDRLHQLADEHGIEELHDLAEATRRRPPLRVAPKRWHRLSEAEQAAVRAMFEADRKLGVRDLANRFGTSIGRISEAIRGRRG